MFFVLMQFMWSNSLKCTQRRSYFLTLVNLKIHSKQSYQTCGNINNTKNKYMFLCTEVTFSVNARSLMHRMEAQSAKSFKSFLKDGFKLESKIIKTYHEIAPTILLAKHQNRLANFYLSFYQMIARVTYPQLYGWEMLGSKRCLETQKNV